MTIALYGTIWLSLLLLVVAESGRRQIAAGQAAGKWAWPVFVAGALLVSAHVVIALGVRYGFDHDLAVRETARQAAAVYGFEWRGNIFVSYAFVVAWFVESIRWRGDAARREPRSRLVLWIWRGFFFVIIANAAIVFAVSPLTRAAGTALVAVLIWAWRPHRDTLTSSPNTLSLSS